MPGKSVPGRLLPKQFPSFDNSGSFVYHPMLSPLLRLHIALPYKITSSENSMFIFKNFNGGIGICTGQISLLQSF